MKINLIANNRKEKKDLKINFSQKYHKRMSYRLEMSKERRRV